MSRYPFFDAVQRAQAAQGEINDLGAGQPPRASDGSVRWYTGEEYDALRQQNQRLQAAVDYQKASIDAQMAEVERQRTALKDLGEWSRREIALFRAERDKLRAMVARSPVCLHGYDDSDDCPDCRH